jgi:hypothetical protein
LRWGNGDQKSGQRKPKKPVWVDYLSSKTQTQYNFTHSSEAKTQSWAQTEESSRTTSQSWSKTDATSIGDEITYELTYDHKVAPETLMDLPEDQMLAPHVVEGHSVEGHSVEGHGVEGHGVAGRGVEGNGAHGRSVAGQRGKDAAMAGPPGDREGIARQTKMVALVVDPAVIGDESVAHVQPGEIPAYQPPAPAVSAQVPDYRRMRELDRPRPGS